MTIFGGVILLLGILIVLGFFMVDRKTARTEKYGVIGPQEKTARQESLLKYSGDLSEKLEKLMQLGKIETIDLAIDEIEGFTAEKQALIRTFAGNAGFIKKYEAGLCDPKPRLRAKAAERLGKLGGEGVSLLLFQTMADKNEEVRLTSTAALKILKDPSISEHLVEALKFPNKWLPARIAEVLVALGELSEPALEASLNEPDPVVRGYVLEILAEVGGPKVPAIMQKALEDENGAVRVQAARVLGKPRFSASLPYLVKLLHDPEIRVRVQAIRSIGKIGGIEAVQCLKSLTNHDDSVVRSTAQEAIRFMESLKG